MNQNQKKWSLVLLMFSVAIILVTGCTAATVGPKATNSCVMTADLNKQIAAEASLEDFSCMVKKWEGVDTLHYKVAVKNISKKDQRFKVNIFLENGKAVGGLLPRKTKKGLVKPGQTITFAYPVNGVSSSSGKVDVFVKTMSK